jgi:hypothetical protein
MHEPDNIIDQAKRVLALRGRDGGIPTSVANISELQKLAIMIQHHEAEQHNGLCRIISAEIGIGGEGYIADAEGNVYHVSSSRTHISEPVTRPILNARLDSDDAA